MSQNATSQTPISQASISKAFNANFADRAVARTREMDWQTSPSPTVWRKRVYLDGAIEAGRVTSVVRYDRGAVFSPHDHPAGEEILVLEGTFSDESGDYPAGFYLLNPDGYRHAPFSEEGCVIFVKLRQYPGRDRQHLALDVQALPWQPGEIAAIATKTLYEQPGYPERVVLEKWEPETAIARFFPEGAELFLLEGELLDIRSEGTEERYAAETWLRYPPGSKVDLRSPDGCVFYLRTGGFL